MPEAPRHAKLVNRAIVAVALIMVVYHMASTQYLLVDPIKHQDIHLAFALTLVFLSGLKARRWQFSLAFLLFSLIGAAYIFIFAPALERRIGLPNTADIIVGIIIIIVVLEASRRTIGATFTILSIVFIIYALTGYYIPKPFHTTQIEFSQLVSELTTNLSGIYGTVLNVSANYIFLFVIFGGIIGVSSASRFFYQFASLFARKLVSAAAMTAVFGSSLVGMVTGTPASNCAICGSFTIPLMKKSGYKAEQAAAIEAASSTCGQIMPPVMGAAAFVMAGMTGISYISICIAAFIPAVLYVLSVGVYAHLQALKIKVTPVELKLDLKELLYTSPTFIIPVAVITVLFMLGFSPQYVGFWSVLATLVLTLIVKPRPSFRELIDGFTKGAMMGAVIGATSACMGIIVRVVEMTGLGVKLGAIVADLSGGVTLIALILTAIATLILGCGVPTVPAYLLVSMVAAPVLVNLGYSIIQSHLFVLYLASMSMVTPPVAPAAIVAAQMAGAGYFRTSLESVKPAVAGFIVPFVFMWIPLLILQPGQFGAFQVVAVVGAIITIISMQAGITGHFLTPCTTIERIMSFAVLPALFGGVLTGTFLLLWLPIVIFAILLINQLRRRHQLKSEVVTTAR